MTVEHVITGHSMWAHLTCGACGRQWDQPGIVDLTDTGHLVCPHCNHAARSYLHQRFANALSEEQS